MRKIASGFSHVRIVFQTCPRPLASSTEHSVVLFLFLRVVESPDNFFFRDFPAAGRTRSSSTLGTIQNSCSNTVSPLRIVVLQFPAADHTDASLSFFHLLLFFLSASLPLPFSVSFLFWFCNPLYETSVVRTRWRAVEASGTRSVNRGDDLESYVENGWSQSLSSRKRITGERRTTTLNTCVSLHT